MDVGRHIEMIRRDLESSAVLAGDEAAETSRKVVDAAEPALRLRLLDLLSEAALDVSGQLHHAHVEVRLAGRDPELVVVSQRDPDVEPAPGDDLSARITLRLPEGLKAQIEAAAAREGVSANAWIVRALSRSLEPRTTRRTGNRLQGFARS